MIGIPVMVLSVWFGGWLLLLLTAGIMFVSLRELVAMLKKMQINPPVGVMLAASAILLISAYLFGERGNTWAITLVLMLFMLTVVLRYPLYSPIDGAAGLLGTLYLGLFTYFYLLRTLPEGWIWLLFMLVGTWASDTTAYFVGKRFGRRKLAPSLSPGKTVAGGIGGIAGSLLVAVLFYVSYPFLPVTHLLIMGLLLGVMAQFGDLWESVIKRASNIKDTGKIIPGHGGMLDRFDSMFFTAPLVYYYLAFFWF
jgi:phosphatidate cytidylyltransferase